MGPKSGLYSRATWCHATPLLIKEGDVIPIS